MIRPSIHPSVRPIIHPLHEGDNHVAINLIVQHIHTKLGQHDLYKIYPNVYVIQSTFLVFHTLFTLSATTICKNKQHVNPNYKLAKFFWVASVEKWPLQAKYSIVSFALQLQIAEC
jgi:hypothetical protein